jgi:hypothetical protein
MLANTGACIDEGFLRRWLRRMNDYLILIFLLAVE